jgi:hypothetical protein
MGTFNLLSLMGSQPDATYAVDPAAFGQSGPTVKWTCRREPGHMWVRVTQQGRVRAALTASDAGRGRVMLVMASSACPRTGKGRRPYSTIVEKGAFQQLVKSFMD